MIHFPLISSFRSFFFILILSPLFLFFIIQDFAELIKKCWAHDRNERPSAAEVLLTLNAIIEKTMPLVSSLSVSSPTQSTFQSFFCSLHN